MTVSDSLKRLTASPPGVDGAAWYALFATENVPTCGEKPEAVPPLKFAERKTSRCAVPLPACGSDGPPCWSAQAASCCSTRPSSPFGSPLRAGSLLVSAARVGSAPSDFDSAYRKSISCGCSERLMVARPYGENGTR